jgi:hypothetical protein
MKMLAAPIGLFAPLQIGRCPVGNARSAWQLPIFTYLSQANPRQRDFRCFRALAVANVPRAVWRTFDNRPVATQFYKPAAIDRPKNPALDKDEDARA